MGIVQGSEAQAKPIVVGKNIVYVHNNIVQVEKKDEENEDKFSTLFQYEEIQYGKDEYIQMMAQKNTELQEQLVNTQLALCEVYELVAQGGEDDNG
jgi:hypothetical protein